VAKRTVGCDGKPVKIRTDELRPRFRESGKAGVSRLAQPLEELNEQVAAVALSISQRSRISQSTSKKKKSGTRRVPPAVASAKSS
jgi:hypothetical protein